MHCLQVSRRFSVEEELARVHELLRRAEHAWLEQRAAAERLQAGHQGLQEALAAAEATARDALAARDGARGELAALAASRASQDVDLMRTRHEYETDEILVVRGARGAGTHDRFWDFG